VVSDHVTVFLCVIPLDRRAVEAAAWPLCRGDQLP